MKLYMNPLSPNVRRVRLTAAVLGIDPRGEEARLREGRAQEPRVPRAQPERRGADARGRRLRADRVARHHAVPGVQEARVGTAPARRGGARRRDALAVLGRLALLAAPAALAFERLLKGMMGLGEPDERKIEEALGNFRRFGAVLNKRLDGQAVRRRQHPDASPTSPWPPRSCTRSRRRFRSTSSRT